MFLPQNAMAFVLDVDFVTSYSFNTLFSLLTAICSLIRLHSQYCVIVCLKIVPKLCSPIFIPAVTFLKTHTHARARARAHTHTHIYTHTHIHTHTHTHTHTYIHTHTYTHTHTHIHTIATTAYTKVVA